MTETVAIRSLIEERLERCYGGGECAWEHFYRPRWEWANFATRYHLVYPALAYFVRLRQEPQLKGRLRPQLDAMYRGLLHPRTWQYWHDELGEETWPLLERNLTFAGRLATFVGLYIDTFGEPPAARIELDGRATTYHALSESLWRQAESSPSQGVTCYHHQAMVMCNVHLLINNVLHDRLFGTHYAQANESWLRTVDDHLLRGEPGPLFFYGTKSNSCEAQGMVSLGIDIWALFLMSGVVPERVRTWFSGWRENVRSDQGRAFISIPAEDEETESSSTLLATAWSFCLARELGADDLAESLRRTLDAPVTTGCAHDPLISGLYLLGDRLRPGEFHALVNGKR